MLHSPSELRAALREHRFAERMRLSGRGDDRFGDRLGGRRRGGGGGAAPPVYLLDSAASTFSRSTATFAQTSATTVAAIAADARAVEDLGDGWGALTSIERQWSQIIADPRSLNTGWAAVIGGGSVWTADYAAGPDGLTKAQRLNIISGGVGRWHNNDLAVASGALCTMSFWVRATSGSSASQWRLITVGGTGTARVGSVGTAWERRTLTILTGDTTMTLLTADGRAAADVPTPTVATAQDTLSDFTTLRMGAYGLRSVSGTGTQAPDDWQWPDGSWDTRLATGSWSIYLVPRYANTDLASGDVRWLLSFADDQNGVRLRHDGTAVRVECIDAGAVVATSGYIAFAATDRLAITVATATSKVTVNGISGATAAALTWPVSGALRLGGICGAAAGSGQEIDGRVSLPWAAGT